MPELLAGRRKVFNTSKDVRRNKLATIREVDFMKEMI
jgi:hypothetical protein